MTAQPSEIQSVTEKQDRRLYIACAVLLVGIHWLDLKVPLGVAVAILYISVILLALRSSNKRFIVFVTIIASVFTIVPLFHKAPIEEMWKAVSNRLLALFSVWLSCYLGLHIKLIEEKRERTLREREKALEEVRVLRGFLPICASCKKIRDYEGSWTLIEKYISEHSEAEFSHGLCPDCTRKLFPDYFPARTEADNEIPD